MIWKSADDSWLVVQEGVTTVQVCTKSRCGARGWCSGMVLRLVVHELACLTLESPAVAIDVQEGKGKRGHEDTSEFNNAVS